MLVVLENEEAARAVGESYHALGEFYGQNHLKELQGLALAKIAEKIQ